MTLIEKLFGNVIFQVFVQEILSAEVGKSVLGGHATVTAVTDHSATLDVKFDGQDYEMTFTHKVA